MDDSEKGTPIKVKFSDKRRRRDQDPSASGASPSDDPLRSATEEVGEVSATDPSGDAGMSSTSPEGHDGEAVAESNFLDDLRRVQADFDNYRKRMLREQTALVERATEGLIEQLLPSLDALDSALASIDASQSEEVANVRKGLELVRSGLFGVLEKSGLSRIDAEGKPFDPNEHDAVMQDDGDGEPVVTEVVRPGYRLKGRVLRPAMVKVTR